MDKVVDYTCDDCEKVYSLHLPLESLKEFEEGAMMQVAFSHLTPDERELMISGVCGECFDFMFPEE